MSTTAQLMTIGQTISHPAGRVTITLQYVRPGAYTVTTYQGGTLRIEDNCGSYTTEAEARAVARLYAETYRAEYVAELTRELHAAQRRRDGNRIELLNEALDRLDTPAQAMADKAMLAGIAETIRTGRPTRPAHALSGWGQIKANHAGELAKDRANRTAQPALFGTEAAR